jgi:hypothetical protein
MTLVSYCTGSVLRSPDGGGEPPELRGDDVTDKLYCGGET